MPNRPVALQCLNNLKRMLYKNPDFHNEYNRLMMEKGYAARISEKQLDRSDPSCGCQGVRWNQIQWNTGCMCASSHCCALYMLRRRAEDKRERTTPQALETVLNSFHVYDCLSSVALDDHAVALAKDLRVLCLSGGFRLTKWTRNSRVLLLLIL